MSRQRKSSVNIPEAARRPHVSSISNNFSTEISVHRNDFNVTNAVSPLHDFKVGLTSVQGKLELLDSSNSYPSNFTSSKRLCTCTSLCIYDMINGTNSDDYGFIPLQPLGRLYNRDLNCNSKMGYVDMQKLLCHTGVPNCIGAQNPIPSDLNIPLWEQAPSTITGIIN